MPLEDIMRSELVFGAMTHVPNRFLLTKLVSKAIREFHKPNACIQQTANEVFERFTRANPVGGALHTGNLRSFVPAKNRKTHSEGEELEQSVA
jgi:hypothetical protein